MPAADNRRRVRSVRKKVVETGNRNTVAGVDYAKRQIDTGE